MESAWKGHEVRPSGGEGGIRTHASLNESLTYRFQIPIDATIATDAVAHCPRRPKLINGSSARTARAYPVPGAYGAILGHSVGCRLITTFSHQSCLSYLHGKTVHPNGPEPQTSFASIYQT